MKITPIAVTQINWADLLRQGQDVVGRSVSRSLDQARIQPGDLYSVIAALKELEEEGSDPRTSVKEANFQLYHLSCSFLVEVSERETDYLRNMEGLTVTTFQGKEHRNKPTTNLLLITGTFAQWQVTLSRKEKDETKKELFEGIVNWFKRFNLGELF